MIPDIKELNFPQGITLTSAEPSLNDMGERIITAKVKIDGSITPDFSYDREIEFQGEKYIHPLRKPQASKSNESLDSEIDLTFEHWLQYQLKRYFFVTLQPIESGTAVADKYIASVSLNLGSFCNLFNQVLDYYFNGNISLDLNPDWEYAEEPVTIEINYTTLWDVLQKMYELFAVRWEFGKSNAYGIWYKGYVWAKENLKSTSTSCMRDIQKISNISLNEAHSIFYNPIGRLLPYKRNSSRKYLESYISYPNLNCPEAFYVAETIPTTLCGAIRVGYPSNQIDHIFEYGFNGGLLKIERQVQDSDIFNMILGRGGEKNLPYRYFKDKDEDNDSFSPDPDWVPELSNIYFNALRGATFRSYIQGWKYKRYTGTTIKENAYAPWAWQLGYSAAKFNPIEYVKDDDSIRRYGELMNGLDNNEEIFPTIQGVAISPYGRVDQTVAVEQIINDEIKETDNNAITVKLDPMTMDWGSHVGAYSTLVERTKEVQFTVPKGKRANFYLGNVNLSEKNLNEPIWNGLTEFIPPTQGNFIKDKYEIIVKDRNTEKIIPAVGVPSGDYSIYVKCILENTSPDTREVRLTIRDCTAIVSDANISNLNTFSIWVKNIWQTEKLECESDIEYAERVWTPILGGRDGEEAKIVFSTGWLSTSQDYEFKIVETPHYDTSKSLDGVSSHWRITLGKSDAEFEATGKLIPSTMLQGNDGDFFFFTGIDMPHFYVVEAEKRLDDWKKDELAKVCSISPTWVITFDKVRIANDGNPNALIEQIKVGSSLRLADKRFVVDEDGNPMAYETLYVQSVNYKYNSDSLIPDVDVVLGNDYAVVANPISKLQGEVSALTKQIGTSLSNVSQAVRATGDKIYLRKDASDRTPYALTVGGEFNANKGAMFGQFSSGSFGGAIDRAGNAEFESVIVRSFMQIYELIVNRQRTIEGDVLLTEGDTIESVKQIGTRIYKLKLHEEWQGYQTAQYDGNVIRGIFNNITQRVPDAIGQTSINNATYYTSWMKVINVDAANNEIDVVLYNDEDTPAKRNFPPVAKMKFARWGNDGDSAEQRIRQNVLYLSSTEGRIKKHSHVTKPIIDEGNIAISLGTIPEFLTALDARLKQGDEALYAKTLVAQNFIQLDYLGKPEPVIVWRGEYSANETYYDGSSLAEYNQKYERSLVLYQGCQWLCSKTGTKTPPNRESTDWTLYLGSSSDVDFAWCSKDTYSAPPEKKHPFSNTSGEWTNNASNAVWMALSRMKDGVWSDWEITKIKGKQGQAGDSPAVFSIISNPSYVKANENGLPEDNQFITAQVFVTQGQNIMVDMTGFGYLYFWYKLIYAPDVIERIQIYPHQLQMIWPIMTQCGLEYYDYPDHLVASIELPFIRKGDTGQNGKDGQNATQYLITPSADSVLFREIDGASYPFPEELSAEVKLIQGNSAPQPISNLEELGLTFEYSYSTNGVVDDWKEYKGAMNLFGIRSSKTSCNFRLRKDAVILALISVPFIRDGKDGQDGQNGENAVSINVSPRNIVFKRGDNSQIDVYVDVYDGTEKVEYSEEDSGFVSSPFINPPSDLKYVSDVEQEGHRRVYRLKPTLNPSFNKLTLSFMVMYKNMEYIQQIYLTVVEDGEPGIDGKPGQDGENAVEVSTTPSEIVHKKGSAKEYIAYVDVYDGNTRIDPANAAFSTIPNLPTNVRLDWGVDENNRWFYKFKVPSNPSFAQVELPFTVTYKDVIYYQQVSITVVQDGIPGVKGEAGPYVPPPMLWRDYPDDYEFQDGSEGTTRLDIVLVENAANSAYPFVQFRCRDSHTKADADAPIPGKGSEWWEEVGVQYKVVASDVLLANQAYINLLSSNGVRIYNEDRQIVGQMSSISGAPDAKNISLPFFIGGVMRDSGIFDEQPNFALDTNGKAYFGGVSGKHIEIDPKVKKMDVYDDAGKVVATHSGAYIDIDEAVPNLTSNQLLFNQTFNPDVLSFGSIRDSNTAIKTFELGEGYINGNGTLKISIPSFNLSAKAGGNVSGQMASMASGTLTANIYINNELVDSIHLGSVFSTDSNSTNNIKTEAMVKEYRIGESNPWKIEIVLKTAIANPNTESKGTVTANAAGSSAKLIVELTSDGYRAEYAANGFVISTNSKNFIYALFDNNNQLHFMVVADGKTIINSGR